MIAATPEMLDAATRAAIYHLLARLYVEEVTEPLLAPLREHPSFAAALPPGADDVLLARLRAEYTRLFVLNVHPYESAYVEADAMLNAGSSQLVASAYAAAGYAPAPTRAVGAPDHIGLELDFVAALAEREAGLAAEAPEVGTRVPRREQARFLARHLASWGPAFALAVGRAARHPFYRELASFTAEFLLADLDALAPEGVAIGAPAEDPVEDPGGDLRPIVRRLATPALAGFHLSREEIFRIGGELQLPVAPVERWLMLDQLFHGAARYGQLDLLLAALEAEADHAARTYRTWQREYAAAAAAIEPWRARADATCGLIAGMRQEAGTAAVRAERQTRHR